MKLFLTSLLLWLALGAQAAGTIPGAGTCAAPERRTANACAASAASAASTASAAPAVSDGPAAGIADTVGSVGPAEAAGSTGSAAEVAGSVGSVAKVAGTSGTSEAAGSTGSAAGVARTSGPAGSVAEVPDLETLAAEVAALRERATGWDRIVERLPRISGYVQAGFEWSETASTLFLKRVRLSFAGDLAAKLDYRIQLECCVPRLVDAYLRYRPFEQLNLQAGEFKLPFSIENTDYVPLKHELIEYPLALRKLMGFNDLCGLSATGRDLGAMLYGGFFRRGERCIVSYDIGVFNGEGLNTRDRNRSKDLCARLMLRPVEGLQLAGSYYRGEYGADYRKRIRYGAGACYDRGAVVLRGEWIGGTTGMPDGDGALRDLDSEGWYAVAGWRATKTLLAAVRYDIFREDASARDSRQTNYTAGLVWQPVKQLRCQLNYTYEEYARRGAADRNVVALMLTGIF